MVKGAVLGGGLLGLEAAGALQALGAKTTVLQVGTHLMSAQVDLGGGEALRRLINQLGVGVRLNAMTTKIRPHRRGGVGRLDLADGGRVDADVVVIAAGVRPRDELGRASGLEIGERGGIVVDDTCLTSDLDISAVGEVACIQGATHRARRPRVRDGRDHRRPAARRRRRRSPARTPPPSSSSPGVDVASFGDAFGETPGALEIVWADPVGGVYKKLVMSDDARTLLGGVLVGDASAYASLRPMLGRELPGDPAAFLLPEGGGGAPELELPDDAAVCSCNNVSAGTIRGAVTDHACTDLGAVKACTRAGTSCGSCLPLVKKLVDHGAGGAGHRGQHRAVRALRPVPRAALRRRPGRRASRRSRGHRAVRHPRRRARLRHLQADGRVDPGDDVPRARPRGRAGRRCRTPTTT